MNELIYKSKILIFNLIVLIGFWSYAFEFTPSVVEFAPEGRSATQKYNIYNSMAISVAVEISSAFRNIDEEGKETLTPSQDFNIYPKLFTLKPGESRTVKVTYVGDKKITQERAYRIIAEQLSVDLKKKEEKKSDQAVMINFLYKYETSAYVKPSGAKSKIEVSSLKVLSNDKKEKTIEIIFNNIGTAHQVFQNWTLEVLPEGEGLSPVQLTKKNMKNFPEFNLLAGHKVKIILPWPEGLKANPKSISYKVESE